MLIHNINPVIVTVFGLEIRYYGLVYALGFLFVLWLTIKLSKREKIKNLDKNTIYDLFFWMMLTGVIVSRLFHVFLYEPGYYLANPAEIIAFWHGGMSIHGGLAGGIAAALIFCRKKKIKFYEIADIVILPFPIVLAFGSLANFFNAELVGPVTNVPWCVQFPGYEGCRHPTVLYQLVENFFLAGVLAYFYNHKKKLRYAPGTIFWLFLGVYSILRFIVQFWRPEPAVLLGLDVPQLLSIVLIAVSAVMLWRLNKRK